MVMSGLIAVAAIATGMAFCRYKAIRYDGVRELFEVQLIERETAPKIVECLLRNFSLLSDARGLITPDVVNRIESLPLNDDDKFLIWQATRSISADWVVDENPWFLALHRYYQRTPIGHIVGLHKEGRSTAASVSHSAGAVFEIEVEDWGIARQDLETYVERVKSRRIVCADLRVNRYFP